MVNILKGNWGVDSNIIIYALDKKSSFFKKAEKFFTTTKNLNFYITQQNIVEIERVLIGFYKIDKEEAIESLERFFNAFQFNIISPLPTTLSYYHQILKNLSSKGDFFDYYLAATYLDNEVYNLLTVNVKDFLEVKQLTVVNPFDYF